MFVLCAGAMCFPQHGVTASLYAAYQGHEDVVELLLDSGASPNVSDPVCRACGLPLLSFCSQPTDCPVPVRKHATNLGCSQEQREACWPTCAQGRVSATQESGACGRGVGRSLGVSHDRAICGACRHQYGKSAIDFAAELGLDSIVQALKVRQSTLHCLS